MKDIPFLKILLSTSYREIFSFEQYECGVLFCSVSDPDSIGSADPDSQSGSGSMQAQNKKVEEISCVKSLNDLCRDLIRHV